MIKGFICAALVCTCIFGTTACTSNNKTRDTGIKTTSVQQEEVKETENLSEDFDFSTEDIDGNTVSYKDFSDAKIIMVNYWEPWCSPCVGEMPDLEALYEAYKDQGLVILGVFSTEGADNDVRAVIEEAGITYPILRADENLTKYMQDYVPATIFVDSHGKVLSDEPYIGAKTADAWEAIIKEFLK